MAKSLPPITEDQFRDAILKRITDKDSAVELTLKRFVQLVDLLARKKGETDIEVSTQASSLGKSILQEIEQFRLEVAKEELIQKAIEIDISHYEEVYQQKQNEIVKVRKEIEELRQTLAQERSKKQNKEEYLALAKLIHGLPKREESERAIEELKASLAEVENRNQDTRAEFEEKSKQYQLLLFALNSLSSELDEEKGTSDSNREEESRGVKRRMESEEAPSKKQRGDDKQV